VELGLINNMEYNVKILIFEERGWWVAQCLEYNIAAQAKRIDDVVYEFERMFSGRILAAKELGIDPFEDLHPPSFITTDGSKVYIKNLNIAIDK